MIEIKVCMHMIVKIYIPTKIIKKKITGIKRKKKHSNVKLVNMIYLYANDRVWIVKEIYFKTVLKLEFRNWNILEHLLNCFFFC